MSDNVLTKAYGQGGGTPFDFTTPKSIGLYGGQYVDSIRINGGCFGGGGGGPSDPSSLVLSDDEYICEWQVRSGEVIDWVTFKTSTGRRITAGSGGGGERPLVSNARVLAIGGTFATLIGRLEIMYVENYRPSRKLSDAKFILHFDPPGSKMVEHTESSHKTCYAYTKVSKHMMSQKYSASVKGEYYAKVSASANLSIQNSEQATISNKLEDTLKNASTRETKIGAKQVGLAVVTGTLMQGEGDASPWMFPTGSPQFAIVDIKGSLDLVRGAYDLTGTLDMQIPELASRRKQEHGLVYYE